MSKLKEIRVAQIDFIGPINNAQTVFLAKYPKLAQKQQSSSKKKLEDEEQDNRQTFLVKVSMTNKPNDQYERIKNLLRNNQHNIIKPDYFALQNNYLYLCQKVQPISLESVIYLHRKQNMNFDIDFIKDFSRVFDILNKLNRMEKSSMNAGFFHGNLKPSNIFMKINEDGIDWLLSQTNILTVYPSKYYTKPVANKSQQLFNPLQADYYSLGIMLTEMVTLKSLQEIAVYSRKSKVEQLLKQTNVPHQLIDFIYLLLNPSEGYSRDTRSGSGINNAYHRFKEGDNFRQNKSTYNKIQEQDGREIVRKILRNAPDYQKYEMSSKQLIKWMKSQQIPNTLKDLKQTFEQKQYKPVQVLQFLKDQIDPDYSFMFSKVHDLQNFFQKYKVKIDDYELFMFRFYFTFGNQFNYLNIFLHTFQKQDIVQGIIAACIRKFYSSVRQYFESLAKGKPSLKFIELINFFKQMLVPIAQKQLIDIMKRWITQKQSSSVRFQQFKRTFDPIVGDMSHINSPKKENNRQKQKQKRSHSKRKGKSSDEEEDRRDYRQDLVSVMQQLQKKVGNLVSFFRLHDSKAKWSVFSTIQDQIKKYIKARKQPQLRKIFNQMYSIAAVGTKRQIAYIDLLKKLKIYQPIQLFRMALTQKINESDRYSLYKKYQKLGKGWNYESFLEFNYDEMLEFNQIQLKNFKISLDKDESGFIDEKQLMYKLTGIKQFDLEHIVEQIKDWMKKRNKKFDLFDVFLEEDANVNLLLDSSRQLQNIFKKLNIQITENHCQQLYDKFSVRKKFQFLVFLRYFYELQDIFIEAVKLVVKFYHKDNFQKLFTLGLQKGKSKWTRQSLQLINQNFVLGFKDTQIGQVWKKFDKQQQNSLTKDEIAEIFQCEVQKREQFFTKNVESLQDFHPRKQKDKKIDKRQQSSDDQKPDNKLRSVSQQLQKNELIRQIKNQDLLKILASCYNKSEDGGSIMIELEDFVKILNQQYRIKCSNSYVQKNLPNFIQEKSRSVTLINYFKLLLMVTQFHKQPEKQKSQMMIWFIKTSMKDRRLTLEDIFNLCKRKDRMKLTDFQNVMKKILGGQIYFQDIEDVWKQWGQPNILSVEDFELILSDSSKKIKKQFTFQQKRQKEDSVKRKNFGDSDNQDISLKSQSRRGSRDYDSNYKNQKSWGRDQNKFNSKRKDSEEQIGQQKKKWTREPDSPIFKKFSNKQFDDKRFSRDQSQNYPKDLKKRQFQSYQQKRNQKAYEKNINNKQRQRDRNSRKDSVDEEEQTRDKKLKAISKEKRTSMQQKLTQRNQAVTGKQALLNKLQKMIRETSANPLNQLFAYSTTIQKNKFVNCLIEDYKFKKKQAQQLASSLSSFGKIKVETIKKILPKNQKQTSKQKGKVQFSSKTPQKYGSQKIIQQKLPQKAQKRMINPKKQRLNAPLIKQHIKILISSFAKRFAVQEMQRYFFQDSDSIHRQQFVKKCKDINNSIPQTMYDKIFDFLKPSTQDEVSIISFKIAFNYDQGIKIEQNYLPQQLQKQLKQIFDKADKDKSGTIESGQVQTLLISLGFNQTKKQIQNIFMKIDMNFDNKISFQQFKIFIQDFILPLVNDFDEEVDQLLAILKMNDVFNTGCLSTSVLIAILQRYGVKLTNQQAVHLTKYIGNQSDQIPISNLISALSFPSNPNFSASAKSGLYKIRYKKRTSFKDIQKVFGNISSNFILAYTSMIMKRQQLKRSSCFEPVVHQSLLFYNDFYYKELRKVKDDQNQQLLSSQLRPGALLIQIEINDACGIPIPQNSSLKSNVLKRSVNIAFFDLSAQSAKYAICSIQACWDEQKQDEWTFQKNNKNIFVKIDNFDIKKFEKTVILFEFIITLLDSGKTIDISCGSASISLKQLVNLSSRTNKKLSMIAGIPNKSKQIDKTSVTKRSGWKSIFGASDVPSQLNIQLNPSTRFQNKVAMLAALPQICIVNRKALHYVWSFRQFFAQKSVDRDQIIPDYGYNFKIRAFLLSFDIEDVSSLVFNLWRQKLQPYLSNVKLTRSAMMVLLQDLHLIFNCKQFQLKQSCPTFSVINNKSLYLLRQKMITQVFENVQNYVRNQLPQKEGYKRKRNYGYNYSPMIIENRPLNQSYLVIQNMLKTAVK